MKRLKNKNKREMLKEDKAWLNANLADFPEFDWGPEEPPKGKLKGVGIVVKNNNSSRN
ncbi:MAG: hypothetical protein PWR08_1711 [Thermoanaerobacterium sp.]|nr:hypothetical protein [Thermoanaerobacterium sp.]